MFAIRPLSLYTSICLTAMGTAAMAEDILGTNAGIPNSSPPVLWPRGMSLEALSPDNLYPNGPQFGLGNTSGGFGLYGSGPMSGTGLSQRAISGLARRELERPYIYIRRLRELEHEVEKRSASSFVAGRGSWSSRTELPALPPYRQSSYGTYRATTLPSADDILMDRPDSVDAILQNK